MELLDVQANIKTNIHITKRCIGFLFHRKVCGSEICFLQNILNFLGKNLVTKLVILCQYKNIYFSTMETFCFYLHVIIYKYIEKI